MLTMESVLELLEEICGTDVVKQNPDVDLFKEGLLDSFGTVSLLVETESRFGIMVAITDFERDEWNTPSKIFHQLETRQ